MKQVQHVEAGDKIYILSDDEVTEITLTDSHINDRSEISPAFLAGKLRLASPAVKNDQVKLEQGYFYDNSVGMSTDYGYYFDESDVKAFASKEALDAYLSSQSERLKLMQSSLDQLNEDARSKVNEIIRMIEAHVAYIKSIGATKDDLSHFEDYEYVNDLYRSFRGKSMLD